MMSALSFCQWYFSVAAPVAAEVRVMVLVILAVVATGSTTILGGASRASRAAALAAVPTSLVTTTEYSAASVGLTLFSWSAGAVWPPIGTPFFFHR